MLKTMIKGAVVGAAMLGLVGTAAAADYELNLYGASAQHKFWNAAVPAFMDDAAYLDCDSVDTKQLDKHGISVGTNCNADGTKDDNVTIRYSSKNSSYGIGAACGLAGYSEPSYPGEIKMCDTTSCVKNLDGTYSGLARKNVHVGASDVELSSFTQTVNQPTTNTYNYDEQCGSAGNQSQEFLNAGCDTILDGSAKSVVVPFGFFVNNAVTQYRCTAPAPTGPDGEHYAYPHWGWQCDPSKTTAEGYNVDCQGYYKCFDGDGEGPRGKTCGGTAEQAGILGDTCTYNLDCKNDLAETKCEAMPLDNLSRLMVLMIFSSDNEQYLDRWSQFGPWYPDAGIVRCMRCAGSGTHATFDMQVFRGDASIMDTGIHGRFYHHESSSDLTKCVDENGWPAAWGTPDWAPDVRYAVGYADVDKIIKSSSYPNTHIVKYQGVEPARAKIENNEYNFWAAQSLYWNTAEISDTTGGRADHTPLLTKLVSAAQNSAFLNTVSPQNMFWTTAGDMAGQKVPYESAYPTVVP